MTPDQMTDLVKAVGWPICSAIAMFYAMITVGKWYKEANEKLFKESKANAIEAARRLIESNLALNENSKKLSDNTASIEAQNAWWRKVGSDPRKICQAAQEIVVKSGSK